MGALKEYFVMLAADCFMLLLTYGGLKFAQLALEPTMDGIAISYIFALLTTLLLNIKHVRDMGFSKGTSLALILLNPINYLGIVLLCLMVAVWGNFEFGAFSPQFLK